MHTQFANVRPTSVLPGTPGDPSDPAPTVVLTMGLSDVEVMPSERRVPVGRAARITGWHPIRYGHGPVPFDSSLERDFLNALVSLPGFKKVIAQPVTVHYAVWGEHHKYTPDYLVTMSEIPDCFAAVGITQTTFFVEVKHTRLLDECANRLECSLAALRMATGIPVLLLTEQEIRVRKEEYFHD